MGPGEATVGLAVAIGEEAETSAMVAVATRACTKKLRARICSEAGRGEVKRNSISNQESVDPERSIGQHASHADPSPSSPCDRSSHVSTGRSFARRVLGLVERPVRIA